MEGKWKLNDWVLFGIRLIVFISVLYNASVFQDELFIPLSMVIILVGLSYIVPLLLLLKSRRLYFTAEVIFLAALTPIFSFTDTTLTGNFVTYSIMIGFYQEHQTKSWRRWIVLAVLVLGPVLYLSTSPISYISVVISGLVFYGLGLMFNQLLFAKEEIQRKNEIIEQQYRVLEAYAKQVEQSAILQERNRISTSLQHSVSDTFAGLILKIESVQGRLGETLLDDLIGSAYHGLAQVRDALDQLEDLDVDIPVKETMMSIVDNVRKTSPIQLEYIVKGEEKPLSKQAMLTLSRCLQEMLWNAIKIGKAQMIVVTVSFEANQIELRVEDDGIGTENERMADGLATLTEQLAVLRGEFTLSSFLNKGHTALCKIPILVDTKEETMKVMIVDPNPYVRESLVHLLELQSSLQVVGKAGHTEEAIRLCEEKLPDVIVLDANLEKIHLTQRLKQVHPSVKIIILTSDDVVEEAVEAIDAGAEGYISKQTPMRELITKIRLVYMGETIISQNVAKQLIAQMKNPSDQAKTRQEKWQQEYGLTEREVEVLHYLAEGLKYKEISERLFLAEGTVRNYISNIYSKLEVNNRKQAVDMVTGTARILSKDIHSI
jgi:two-component system, NarL family, sensor histidine kinase FusK